MLEKAWRRKRRGVTAHLPVLDNKIKSMTHKNSKDKSSRNISNGHHLRRLCMLRDTA